MRGFMNVIDVDQRFCYIEAKIRAGVVAIWHVWQTFKISDQVVGKNPTEE